MRQDISSTQARVLVSALRCGGEVDFESFIAERDYEFNRINFGLGKTLGALRRRGLVDDGATLTDAGRWAAAQAWVATDLPPLGRKQ